MLASILREYGWDESSLVTLLTAGFSLGSFRDVRAGQVPRDNPGPVSQLLDVGLCWVERLSGHVCVLLCTYVCVKIKRFILSVSLFKT